MPVIILLRDISSLPKLILLSIIDYSVLFLPSLFKGTPSGLLASVLKVQGMMTATSEWGIIGLNFGQGTPIYYGF